MCTLDYLFSDLVRNPRYPGLQQNVSTNKKNMQMTESNMATKKQKQAVKRCWKAGKWASRLIQDINQRVCLACTAMLTPQHKMQLWSRHTAQQAQRAWVETEVMHEITWVSNSICNPATIMIPSPVIVDLAGLRFFSLCHRFSGSWIPRGFSMVGIRLRSPTPKPAGWLWQWVIRLSQLLDLEDVTWIFTQVLVTWWKGLGSFQEWRKPLFLLAASRCNLKRDEVRAKFKCSSSLHCSCQMLEVYFLIQRVYAILTLLFG